MTAADLKTIFEKAYNRADWTSALHEIFHIKDLHIIPHPIDLGDNPWEASALELGFFETSEGLLVGLYEVNVPSNKSLNGKVGLRNLMRKVYTNDADAALIVFSQGTSWRFSYASELTIENKETGKRERRQTDPKRYTYIFGRHQLCRTAAERFAILKTSNHLFDSHISISEIEKAFSVDTLTKDFYRELSNWYFWALQHVQFPDDAEKDAEIRNSSNTIRLITRLIFVWFLKQKGLIPDELFEKDKVFALLKHQGKNKSTYYKAILQNLFFATLNQEMGKRAFRREGQHYNITNLFRYEKIFVNPTEAIELFKGIPFLNGGLFECLDKPHPTAKTPQGSEKIVRIDGFSDREDTKIIFPDYLFFGGAESVDLNDAYGDSRHNNIKVRGLIDILDSYNFTVEENTPLDILVALDPELLGKVFENLLASYNPETKTTARKQTGSFYTPREIVRYIVDESLIAYFKQKMASGSSSASTDENIEISLRELLSFSGNGNPFSESETKTLVQAIDDIKILDPACGSGAFPMGVLQQLVHALQKLDPDNIKWKQLQMMRTQVEIQAAVASGDTESFASRLKDIAETFDNNAHDYGRKLFLIENCIYGVDIQPIAVQIAKLRFFISLLCEQNINRDRENLGIRALPNLETKFVAANTLIGLDTSSTFKPDSVYILEKQLEEVRHRHFSARTPETKRKYRERDNQLCNQIATELISAGFPATSADQIANWNPYDQNTHAPFFDKYWMFGIEDGFEVVIGNPPYVSAPTMVSNYPEFRQKIIDSKKYKSLHQKWDLYIPFMELGLQLLTMNGVFSMIVPYPITNQNYGLKFRELIIKDYCLKEIVDLNGTKVFENATVSNCIPFITKSNPQKSCYVSNVYQFGKIERVFIQNINDLVQDKNTLVWNLTSEKRETTKHSSFNVLGDYCYISKGMVLNADENTAKGAFSKDDLISETSDKIHCRKYIEAKDIERYRVKKERYLEYNTERCPGNLSRPTFKELYERPKLMFNRLGNLMVILDDVVKYLHSDSMFSAVLWKDLDGVENKSISASVKRYSNFSRKEMIKLSSGINLRYLLGVLNSKYASVLLTNLRAGDYHIYPVHIRNIPIPNVPKNQQKPLVILVDQILSSKKSDLQANTSALESKIDKLV